MLNRRHVLRTTVSKSTDANARRACHARAWIAPPATQRAGENEIEFAMRGADEVELCFVDLALP